MKLIITTIIYFSLITSAFSKYQCFIKIGFSDCINCYYALDLIKDVEKTYIINEEYQDLKKEIFKERVGLDTLGLKIIASDSLYNLFGKNSYSEVFLMENNQIIFKSMLLNFDQKHNSFRLLLNKYNINTKENTINLGKNYHSQCNVKVLQNKQIVIKDNLKNKVLKLDSNGLLIFELDIENLTESIFQKKFSNYKEKLKDIIFLNNTVLNTKSISKIGNIDILDQSIFATINSSYVTYLNSDTIISGFLSILKIDSNNNVIIIPIKEETNKENYYSNDPFFRIIDKNSFQLSVICPNTKLKPHLYANYFLHNNSFVFKNLSEDTIPDYLTKNRMLNYRITPFIALDGIVAYHVQSLIYYKNKEIFKLNDVAIKDMKDIFSLKNSITDLYKEKDVFYISSISDTTKRISTYDIVSDTFNKNYFILNDYDSKTGIHFDKNGNYFFINSKNQLIIKPL